jgi:hypothetical protein
MWYLPGFGYRIKTLAVPSYSYYNTSDQLSEFTSPPSKPTQSKDIVSRVYADWRTPCQSVIETRLREQGKYKLPESRSSSGSIVSGYLQDDRAIGVGDRTFL